VTATESEACYDPYDFEMDKNPYRITIISDAVRVPEWRMAAYAAAKAGAAGFSRALAAKVGRRGITVNCLAPGTIESEHAKQSADPDVQRAVLPGYR
jgi:3-oxoacyl-[acyl-carrier protein] reductase